MKKLLWGVFLILANAFCIVQASLPKIKSMRIWPSPEKTRIVFDLSQPISYKLFSLKKPDRLVIDFYDIQFRKPISTVDLHNTCIEKIRYSNQKSSIYRVVFDLSESLEVVHFTLSPNEYYGHRVVIDLQLSEKASVLALFAQQLPKLSQSPKKKGFLVAIDSGHGGEDPGAIGRYGTREKVVVLQIGKYLKQFIDKQPNMHAILIRQGDYYIPLHKRVARSRQIKADFFVSIHADAALNRHAKGASVYVLSERGASSAAAKFLAQSENQSDLIGGVSLKEKGSVLASVLLDMSQTASKHNSIQAAECVLKSLSSVTPLHKTTVEYAGFAVLKAPDMISILVEAGFLSNRSIERKLRTAFYQKKIAEAIGKGILQYQSLYGLS